MGPVSFFDERAAGWDTPARVDRARSLAAIIRTHVPLSARMRAIDIGSGTGLLGLDLLADVGSMVLADPSEGMVEMARQKIGAGGIEGASAIVYDLPAEPPSEAPFDLAVSMLMLHHVQDTGAVLRSIFELLAPGGRLALVDLDTEDGSFHSRDTPGIHHQGFPRGTLLEITAAAGFVDVGWQIVHQLERDGRDYPLFLLVGTRPSPTPR